MALVLVYLVLTMATAALVFAAMRDLLAAIRRRDAHTAFWLAVVTGVAAIICGYFVHATLMLMGGGR